MKPEEKKTDTVQSNEEAWGFIIVILLLSFTLVFVTRMYVDLSLAQEMIHHYTLRGKDVIVKDDSIVFIN